MNSEEQQRVFKALKLFFHPDVPDGLTMATFKEPLINLGKFLKYAKLSTAMIPSSEYKELLDAEGTLKVQKTHLAMTNKTAPLPIPRETPYGAQRTPFADVTTVGKLQAMQARNQENTMP